MNENNLRANTLYLGSGSSEKVNALTTKRLTQVHSQRGEGGQPHIIWGARASGGPGLRCLVCLGIKFSHVH